MMLSSQQMALLALCFCSQILFAATVKRGHGTAATSIDHIPNHLNLESSEYEVWMIDTLDHNCASVPKPATCETQIFVHGSRSEPNNCNERRDVHGDKEIGGYHKFLSGWSHNWVTIEGDQTAGAHPEIVLRIRKKAGGTIPSITTLTNDEVIANSPEWEILHSHPHAKPPAGSPGILFKIKKVKAFTAQLDFRNVHQNAVHASGELKHITNNNPTSWSDYTMDAQPAAVQRHAFTIHVKAPVDFFRPHSADIYTVAPADSFPGDVSAYTLVEFQSGSYWHKSTASASDAIVLTSSITYHVPLDSIVQATFRCIGGSSGDGCHRVRLFGNGRIDNSHVNWAIGSPNGGSTNPNCPKVNGTPSHPGYTKWDTKLVPDRTWKRTVDVRMASYFRMKGLTISDPAFHAIVASSTCRDPDASCSTSTRLSSSRVDISDVSIISWRKNGDGIHVKGHAKVSNAFIRAQDDSIYCGAGSRNVAISGIVTWNDADGSSFIISAADSGQNAKAENSEIWYARTVEVFARDSKYKGGRMFNLRGLNPRAYLERITFKDITVKDPKPTFAPWFISNSRGYLTELTFDHIVFPSHMRIQMRRSKNIFFTGPLWESSPVSFTPSPETIRVNFRNIPIMTPTPAEWMKENAVGRHIKCIDVASTSTPSVGAFLHHCNIIFLKWNGRTVFESGHYTFIDQNAWDTERLSRRQTYYIPQARKGSRSAHSLQYAEQGEFSGPQLDLVLQFKLTDQHIRNLRSLYNTILRHAQSVGPAIALAADIHSGVVEPDHIPRFSSAAPDKPGIILDFYDPTEVSTYVLAAPDNYKHALEEMAGVHEEIEEVISFRQNLAFYLYEEGVFDEHGFPKNAYLQAWHEVEIRDYLGTVDYDWVPDYTRNHQFSSNIGYDTIVIKGPQDPEVLRYANLPIEISHAESWAFHHGHEGHFYDYIDADAYYYHEEVQEQVEEVQEQVEEDDDALGGGL